MAAARRWQWLTVPRAQVQVQVRRPQGADGDLVAGAGLGSKGAMSSREGKSRPWEEKERKGEGE